MSDELADLAIEDLWALFARLVDPDSVPAGAHDPDVRERLRKLDAGVYVADPEECRSRRVVITPEGIDDIPLVEAPPDPDWERGSPAIWVARSSVSVRR